MGLGSSTDMGHLLLHFRERNARVAAIVAAGSSSISQWPEFAITSCVTLTAALRITAASLAPNDFSPPTARTGIVSFVAIAAACPEHPAGSSETARMQNASRPA